MSLKQNGGDYQIIILLVSIILMIVVCSSSPVHERLRRDSGKDNCNGADDHQQAFCYGFRDDLDQREADVQRCFDKLYHSYKRNRKISHISINEGRCRCTVKAISF